VLCVLCVLDIQVSCEKDDSDQITDTCFWYVETQNSSALNILAP